MKPQSEPVSTPEEESPRFTILDAALEEVLRGESPPDLRESILAAIASGHTVESEEAAIVNSGDADRTPHQRRRVVLVGTIVGVMACLMVLALLIFEGEPKENPHRNDSAGTDGLGVIKVQDNQGRRVTVGFGEVEYKAEADAMELKRGFVVVDKISPDLIAASSGKRISAPTGRILVVRGEKPNAAELQAMAPALTGWCGVEPERLTALADSDTWLSGNGLAFVILQGEAEVFGGRIAASDQLEARVRELQADRFKLAYEGFVLDAFAATSATGEVKRPEFGSLLLRSLGAARASAKPLGVAQTPESGKEALREIEVQVNALQNRIAQSFVVSVAMSAPPPMPPFVAVDRNGDGFIDGGEYANLAEWGVNSRSYLPWPIVLQVYDSDGDMRLNNAEYFSLGIAMVAGYGNPANR